MENRFFRLTIRDWTGNKLKSVLLQKTRARDLNPWTNILC